MVGAVVLDQTVPDMPGFRSMFPDQAGWTSIHRAALSGIRTSCGLRSCASRARRSRCRAWIGTASDHLAMKVAVKVVAAADADAGRGQRVGDGMMTPA